MCGHLHHYHRKREDTKARERRNIVNSSSLQLKILYSAKVHNLFEISKGIEKKE
jgi:hypothetical protein